MYFPMFSLFSCLFTLLLLFIPSKDVICILRTHIVICSKTLVGEQSCSEIEIIIFFLRVSEFVHLRIKTNDLGLYIHTPCPKISDTPSFKRA